ncbi:MAG: sensor diguanylate cyclase [Firmicutes bacterium]|nr:sensor diguanylate cyclase [Bacillota bacterium]
MDFSLYKVILDHLYDGVYFVDNDRRILYWNPSAEKLTGYSSEDIMGSYCFNNKLNHTTNEGILLCNNRMCPLAKTLKDGSLREAELYLQHKNGHRVPVSVRISPIRNENNEIIGAVEIFSDNSCKSHLQEQVAQLKELSLMDSLTRLGNRRYAEIELLTKMDEMRRLSRTFFGVLFADIDYFKRVNDRYGHDIGDEVIKMVAKTIQNGLGDFGTAFRWGGEEFLAIINTSIKEQLYEIAERVRALTEQSAFQLGNDEIRVTISVGASQAQLSDTDEILVKRVDELLYLSKNLGRNRVMIA